MALGAGAVARAVLRRCRGELAYWSRLRQSARRDEARLALVRLREASGLLEGAPEVAMERI